MRTKLFLKNSLYSLGSYILLFVLGLINRKVFVTFLSIEFLGYEGLFSNVFSILSLAEMGIGMVITYNLYQEIANRNRTEIAKLMMIYKNIYRLVGIMVTVISIMLFPFLKLVITKNAIDWNFIYFIYFIQLISIVCTYFLAYRRILFIASQMEFVCIKIDTLVNIISQITKILILIFTKNYLIYLFIAIIQNISTNLIITIRYNKTFGYAKRAKVLYKDYKNRNFFKDVPNLMIHKISYIIYGSADNIVISAILGINMVGLYTNYIIIKTQVWNVISRMLIPMQATIGNLVYSEESMEKGRKIFLMFDLVSLILASFISITFFVLFQPFVELWLGEKYLLPFSCAVLLAINIYIGTVQEILYYFRASFGDFEKDRIYMILAAVVSLGLSIVLAKKFGVAGIIFGKDIGALFFWLGRIKVVFNKYIKNSYKRYLIKQIKWAFLAGTEGLMVFWIADIFPVSIVGLLLKFLICLIIPNTVNLLCFYRTEEFLLIKMYVKQTVQIFKSNI